MTVSQPASGNSRTSGLPDELTRWIAAETHGHIESTRRLPGGNRRQAWAIEVAGARTSGKLFLRYDPADPRETGDTFTIRREAQFYLALRNTDVSIPRIVAVHSYLEAMLVERVEGQSEYSKIADAERKRRISLDLGRHAARLHTVDLTEIGEILPDRGDSIKALTLREIGIWEGLYRQTGIADPLIEFGLRWLLDNIPDPKEPATIVHGDLGPGNFLFDGDRVTALLDWELAHLGDPLEDIAWLSMRTVLEPFPDFAACMGEYEAAAGRSIDLARVRFYRALVEWRVAIIRHRKQGEDVSNSIMSYALNRRLFVEAVANAEGRAKPRYERLDVGPGAREELYETTLDYMKTVISPALSDPFAARRSKSVARIIKYLRDSDRYSAAFNAAEAADLSRLLGSPTGDDLAAASAVLSERIKQGDFDKEKLFGYLIRRVARETQVAEGAMGALAWREFPQLESNPR